MTLVHRKTVTPLGHQVELSHKRGDDKAEMTVRVERPAGLRSYVTSLSIQNVADLRLMCDQILKDAGHE